MEERHQSQGHAGGGRGRVGELGGAGRGASRPEAQRVDEGLERRDGSGLDRRLSMPPSGRTTTTGGNSVEDQEHVPCRLDGHGGVAALVLVPTVAVAASTVVNIKGNPSGNKADVSAAGQLLTTTVDPSSFFQSSPKNLGNDSYTMVATPPSGLALV